MTPERWRQIDRVLQAALARRPDERPAFLADACAGDDELRAEVESLLSFEEPARQLLETPPVELAADLLVAAHSEALLGRAIASYRVIRRIGAGGMGEVYLAEDTRLGRPVALKLLPAYFTSDEQRVRRFQQEARAASALNHANIITIYEIGQADGTFSELRPQSPARFSPAILFVFRHPDGPRRTGLFDRKSPYS
jgi:serine/threonine protein kinase